jgi:hypothetical protein
MNATMSQSRTSRTAPEPLRRPVPVAEPYPIAELGQTLAPACESLRRVIQAPDAVCGSALLAASSLATQGLANVENDGRVHPLSLWFLTIAESGERKSAVDAEAMQPLCEYERTLASEYMKDVAVHDLEREAWAIRRDKAKADAKKADNADVSEVLRAIGPEPPQPMRPSLMVADFTAEGLTKLLAAGRPSVGAFTDEAALVFGGHGMTKESVTRTTGTLSKLWDSGTLDRIRATDGQMKLWGRRFALHLLAQPIIAERALSDEVLSRQGFLARCLFAWPQSTAGSRRYCAENLRHDPAMIQYRVRVGKVLRQPLPTTGFLHNELTPRALQLSSAAAEAWREIHNAIEVAMAPGARYAAIKPWASKAPEQCLRIAGVLTMIDDLEATTIEPATIESAAELTLWHLNEAARLAGTTEVSSEVHEAEALLNWCHATGRELLYSRDALNKGPTRIRERNRFMRAMKELEGASWAAKIEEGAVIPPCQCDLRQLPLLNY